ncbi:restriction endonuclease subunit S [Halomonas aquamarina]|uniref:Restriction endonuclease subunit S n=1 Tax=Vreelandella aquamarina TaxID=77097 RepID=A0ACC5VT93_9GAMM|nr:restriction endonuclease subunit S [Halomonas aquamarina]MBZ5487481.1 restriction endonuclease subunit S [Halomonas aquamarina]
MSNRVPAGWGIHELGDLAEKIEGGGTPPRIEPTYWDGGIPWATVKDLRRVSLTSTAECISVQGLEKSSSKLISAYTMIIACRMAVGKAVYFDRDVAINQDLKAFYPVSGVDWRFILHWYLSQSEKIENLATGSTVKGIRLDDLKLLPIDLPPLPEQKKIAAILSSVDEVIEKTRAQIDKLKDLKTGMMQELLTKGIGPGGVPHTEFKDSPVGRIPVGWESYLLGDVFDLKNGVNKDKDAFGHGVPIISYKNVYVGGGILDSDLSALVEMNEKELSRFRVHFGDVFFTRTSETPDEIGFSNVYLGRRDDVVFNGFVIRARQKNGLFHPNFLKYVFQSNAVRKQMMDNSKFTTRAGISGESLGRIAIAVPDISEQKNIANALDSVEARITKTINKINAIQSFKKALMQDLLTGKVRVNVDARELADD